MTATVIVNETHIDCVRDRSFSLLEDTRLGKFSALLFGVYPYYLFGVYSGPENLRDSRQKGVSRQKSLFSALVSKSASNTTPGSS